MGFSVVVEWYELFAILKIKPLSVASFTNIFIQPVGCHFVLFMISIVVQKFVSLIKSFLFIFVFIYLSRKTGPRKYWHDLYQRIFRPCSRRFIVPCLMFKYLCSFLCMGEDGF